MQDSKILKYFYLKEISCIKGKYMLYIASVDIRRFVLESIIAPQSTQREKAQPCGQISADFERQFMNLKIRFVCCTINFKHGF